jgi:L-asparaginase II
MLEERIARDGAAFTRANDRLLIATLARMGASEAEIRETLGIDEKNQSRIRYAMRAANGPNACQ